MPDRVYSALNTGGTSVSTPEDQIALTNAARSQDWMVQQALMAQRAQQFQAQLADNAANRANQLQIQGAFKDRAGNDQALEGLRGQYQLANTGLAGQNSLGIAGLETAAARAAQAREDDQWQLERPLVQQRNGLRTYASNMLQSELGMGQGRDPQDAMVARGIANMPATAASYTSVQDATPSPYPYKAPTSAQASPYPPANASGIGSLAPVDRLTLLGALAGGGSVPDIGERQIVRQGQQLALNQATLTAAQKRAQQYRDAGQFDQAKAIEATNGLPSSRVAPDDVIKVAPEIQTAIDKLHLLAAKNGDWFDSNPQGVAALATQIIQALTEKGVNPAEAKAYITHDLMTRGQLPDARTTGQNYAQAIATAGLSEAFPHQADDAAPLRQALGY